jgi:transposase
MNKILLPEKRAEYEKLVRITKNVDEKIRLCAILAYDEGHDISDIANILKISESSTYNYINDYLKKNKIANEPKNGAYCKLTPREEIELIKYLSFTTHLTAKSICAYVLDKYALKYTVAGITKWLERNDFVYKKPKPVPSKLDEQKQQDFINYYNELKQNTDNTTNSVIMFMDAVHPEYQSQAVYGWIPKGETKTLPTTNKQFRLHLNGAINLDTMDIFTKEYDTIDAASVVSFFKDLELENPYKTIHIICDNGRSNKNKDIQQYLETSRIKVHYLPPYSPNLNAIERLWKIMRERVTYNKYYPVFADFKDKVHEFFDTTIHEIEHVLKARINDNFEVVRHNSVQLSS